MDPTELATHRGWPRSSTTEHLNVLLDTSIISETRRGKHRYVRLSDAEVAETIERLAALAPTGRSLAAGSTPRPTAASGGARLLHAPRRPTRRPTA
ncbi:MAG: hypothetical protein DLM57_16575 [Pseudonocardiales bacterium]|nr:MAG: hypothetical protein DLM57_16575 [Pseudonocardiales bacterium]